ncbi:tol-pal system YbgF family protein [Planctomycetota bacterium]
MNIFLWMAITSTLAGCLSITVLFRNSWLYRSLFVRSAGTIALAVMIFKTYACTTAGFSAAWELTLASILIGLSASPWVLAMALELRDSLIKSWDSNHGQDMADILKKVEIAQEQQNLDLAIALLEDALDDYPAKSATMLKLAEVHLLANEPARTVQYLRAAAGLASGTEARVLLQMRLVDVYSDYLQDIDSAREVLETVRSTCEGTRFAAFARSRLAALEDQA